MTKSIIATVFIFCTLQLNAQIIESVNYDDFIINLDFSSGSPSNFKVNTNPEGTIFNFNVHLENNIPLITWNILSGNCVSYFSIEKSTNAKEFYPVDDFTRLINSINSNSITVFDNSPFSGLNYYRVKIVDLNGKDQYSEIKSLFVSDPDSLMKVPNQGHSMPFVSAGMVSDTVMNYSIFDLLGREVLNTSSIITYDEASLDVSSLDCGIYFFKRLNSTSPFNKMLVKNYYSNGLININVLEHY